MGAGVAYEGSRRGGVTTPRRRPHSPPEFRCNGVIRNIDAFYDAFGVDEGDRLYLDPSERVRIW